MRRDGAGSTSSHALAVFDQISVARLRDLDLKIAASNQTGVAKLYEVEEMPELSTTVDQLANGLFNEINRYYVAREHAGRNGRVQTPSFPTSLGREIPASATSSAT